MIHFESDYITGAHPKILQRFVETNTEAVDSYGFDKFSAHAKELIREACDCQDADVEFISGGTQTNEIVISTVLKDYEGAVAATTGHINGHEAGAVEYNGKKVLTLPGHDGKIDPDELRQYVVDFYADANHEHMTFPGLVYISHPTEYGTLYTLDELTRLSKICKEFNMQLYMDGARLGYALMSRNTDVSLADIAKLCDIFYIGGTKVGALCGEALVFTKNNKPAHFLASVKKRGALLAKGRVLGVQFETLFTDGLYFEIGRHAIEMAEEMKAIFRRKGLQFFKETDSNQQFVVFENERYEALKKDLAVGFWEKYDDDHTVVRFATTWSTTFEDLAKLETLL